MSKNLEDFFGNRIILYRDLGDNEIGGTWLTELIEVLKCEKIPYYSMHAAPNMMSLIAGEDMKLHPLFAEDCNIEDPYCFDYEYSPKRLPHSFFHRNALDIFISDQTNRFFICHLGYDDEELDAEHWQVYDDFVLPREDIPQFIRLAQKIQNASLSELLV